jgi:hypothetical protein
MESYESLRKAAAGLPHSKALLRNIMRDSVGRLAGAKKQKRQRDAGATVRRRDSTQGLLYARSNSLSRNNTTWDSWAVGDGVLTGVAV